MIDPSFFLRQAQASGIELFTGVPCSLFTSLIDTVIADPEVDYIGAVDPLASEDWTQATWINYTP